VENQIVPDARSLLDMVEKVGAKVIRAKKYGKVNKFQEVRDKLR
jgi:hypothetical protein